ncbi:MULTISPECIES: TetR/AcrR family transcriptional regulator [unclassified Sulfurospirillum]|uniref:TetR/AcrR family transcriptional regulator n=1 Tax=unclassified Sulfurospirillum TaxID=2618290 RepID=UPI0005082B2B|nr:MULTISPECIES: TetR/AcrR family transcriptional regulator [unclassified Sulfurospirillum]KFL33734.1 TetR family transcriptional regulator [Sulfurospirillum sp. SCADC]
METTREKLIRATFDEVFSHGYQGASLSDILAKAGVHKGSMYHFFANKKEMALAAIEETILKKNLQKYSYVETYTSGLLEAFYTQLKDTSVRDFKRGCPIANVVQEMSNIDEEFNTLMKSIYGAFRANIKAIFDKAIEVGEMKPCDTTKLALFTTSTIEGAILAAKASGNAQDYSDVIEELIEHIEGKR